jgi:hypothetical protein
LEEYFKSTPKNITYKSKTTQNEIIDICDDLITRKITNEIREAKFFSILADEASDCGNVEQLSIVVRFVDKKHQIGEEFLGFVPCKIGVSGEAVANTIVSEFFNFSPKRFSLLVKTIEEMLPESSHERLINVCKTRWVARIDGLSVFIEVFPAFMRCFEIIRDNINVQNLESRVCAESWLFVLG